LYLPSLMLITAILFQTLVIQSNVSSVHYVSVNQTTQQCANAWTKWLRYMPQSAPVTVKLTQTSLPFNSPRVVLARNLQ
jgi:hypothetical protein